MAQVAVVQRRFYQLCRNLECSLAATRPGQTLALADQDLAEALRKLKEENQHWARTHGLEEVCAEAERQVKMGQLALTTEERDLYDLASPGRIPTVGSRAGLPLCWQKDAPEALPEVRLVPDGNQYPTRALGFSLFLILLFLGGWVLSGLAPILAWLRTFWPEEVALLGGLGLLVYGVNLWPCLLILCGLGTRFYSLGRMVLRALRKISVFPSRQIQNS
jgi:hypothetical protein